MKINKIYNFSYNYLIKISKGKVSKTDIDSFIGTPDVTSFSSLEDAFGMLLVILQDFQMYPNVIKYHERETEIKKEIHFPNIIYCSKLNADKLADKFVKKFKSNSSGCWSRYCKGIVSGAKFLSGFKDYNSLKATLDSFDLNIVTREALALFLQTKINNMGFAIACNWLKELGYVNYTKPDVHMKDVCQAFGLIDNTKNDLECFEAMDMVANRCGVEPYKLDKVWWLICSGNFYRYGIQLPYPQKTKADFIKAIKAQK